MYIYDSSGKRWTCDIEEEDFKHVMRLFRRSVVHKSGAHISGFSCYMPEEPHRYRLVKPDDVNLALTLDFLSPSQTPTLKGMGE